MPTFTPTEEQAAIVAAAQSTTDNLAVIARAGAAKTSTLVLIAEALPSVEILCLAFNKAIAEEMNARLPANCEAKTLHGLGFAAWRAFIPKSCKLVKSKMYAIVKRLIENLEDKDEREEGFESLMDILDIIGTAKSSGYMPEKYKGHWKSLTGDEDFFESLPLEPTPLQRHLVIEALCESWRDALMGEIDFDDMIYCPALCGVSWPYKALYLIDEAQDLSPLNHHVLKKMVKNRRIIAVGDPLQAIYGFRGADVNSMDKLVSMFNMTPLYLTISFRCGAAITRNAHWIAPDMRSPEWAAEGIVLRPNSWTTEDLEWGDAIICRNNAPLFSLAIRLIAAGKLPEIAGKDIGAPIIKSMKKLGKPNLLKLGAIASVEDWLERELRRARPGAKSQLNDKAAIMNIMIRQTNTLGEAIEYLEALLSRKGRIYLMTGHKSKGLEFDRVWFLDKDLCRIERDQDANIKYVIETRAKTQLAYVTSDSLIGASLEEEE
jgi:DNA helicase II / ATP-dependent DNA helicase PcrA